MNAAPTVVVALVSNAMRHGVRTLVGPLVITILGCQPESNSTTESAGTADMTSEGTVTTTTPTESTEPITTETSISTTVGPTSGATTDETLGSSGFTTAETSVDTTTGGLTDTTGESTGGSTDTTTSGGMLCDDPNTFTIATPPIHVMVAFEKSGAVVNQDNFWDHDADDINEDGFNDQNPMNAATPKKSLWMSMHDTASSAIEKYQYSIDFGAQLFPDIEAQNVLAEVACQTSNPPEVPTMPMALDAIDAAIPANSSLALEGGAATGRGVKSALQHLKGEDSDDTRALVLLVHSSPICKENVQNDAELLDYDTELNNAVLEAWEVDGIATHVFGFDIQNEELPNGSNAHDVFNETAEHGGFPEPETAKYHDGLEADLYAALDATLFDILENETTCILQLPQIPPEEDFVGVKIEGEYANFLGIGVMGCSMQDGWHYTQPDFSEIRLCGTTCDEYRVAGELTLEYC